MNINSKISSWWGSVEIVKINFIPIDPFTQASLEWNKDGESVHLNIQNVTMAAHIDVRVWIAHMIPMWGANFHVKDLNMNFDLSTSDVYNVYPQLHITPKLDALDIDFDFFYITWFIKWFVKPASILPMLEDAITSGIQSLNEAWRNPQKTSGLIGLVGKLLLSLEPVRPIEMNKDTDLIEFGLDGRVFDQSKDHFLTKDCEEKADRLERTHSNQFFIHESTVEDIVKGIIASNFPFEV